MSSLAILCFSLCLSLRSYPGRELGRDLSRGGYGFLASTAGAIHYNARR